MLSMRVATAARRLSGRRLAPVRTYATQQSANPTASFYKTFSRPIAKTLILAVFTYQVAYWTWAKLEADETRQKMDAEIEDLEKKVNEYKEAKAAGQSSSSK